MFVLHFVLFFNLFTLVIFMKVDKIFHHVVDACVEFCFLKKQFLNLTINMQLLYFITRPAKFIQPGTISVRGTVLYRASCSFSCTYFIYEHLLFRPMKCMHVSYFKFTHIFGPMKCMHVSCFISYIFHVIILSYQSVLSLLLLNVNLTFSNYS